MFAYIFTLIGAFVVISLNLFVNEYKQNTIVSDIYIGSTSKANVNNYLSQTVNSNIDQFVISYTFNNNTYQSSANFVEYDSLKTIENIINGDKSDIYVISDISILKEQFKRKLPKIIFDNIDYEALNELIVTNIINMYPGVDIYIMDYLFDFDQLTEVINSFTYYTTSTTDILNIFDEKSIIIEPNSRFSLLNTFNNLIITNEQINIIATGINAVVLNTNFTSFDKANHRVSYINIDSTIGKYDTYVNSAQNRDFSFYNPYDYPYEIVISNVGDNLIFKLIGIPFETEYIHKLKTTEIEHVKLNQDEIPVGATIIYGSDGIIIEVSRYIVNDGIEIKDEVLYVNYFGPVDESYED